MTEKRRKSRSGYLRNLMDEGFVRTEAYSLPDDALIELLLSLVSPRSSQLDHAACELIGQFGDIRGVLTASALELKEIEGISKRAIGLLRLVGEVCTRYASRIKAMPDILSHNRELQRYLLTRFDGIAAEQLLFIFLAQQGVILGEEILGTGTVDRVVAFPRQIMDMALRYNASSLIMVHNHPHAPPLPSARDREEAERLREVLAPFDIVLRDAIVVGHNRCFSIFSSRPL